MFANTFFRRILFNFTFLVIISSIYILLFFKIYTSDTIIISFANTPFNICEKYPDFWEKLKLLYIPLSLISSLICINLAYSTFFTRNKSIKKNTLSPKNGLYLSIKTNNNSDTILPEASLYQNILVTGTIGSGKTSSALYPFTRQLIRYKYDDKNLKLGMLILDVKGNYYSQVKKYASYYRRSSDLVVIELGRKY